MYTDANLRVVTSSQDMTVVGSPIVSESSIDLGVDRTTANVGRDMAQGTKIRVFWTVNTAVTAAGAATVTLQVISASDEDLTADIGVLGQTPALGKAILTAGRDPVIIEINPDLHDSRTLWDQFLGVQFVVVNGDLTAGAFTVDFVMDYGEGRLYYPVGFAFP
jgi:hypothetical protein